jgi:8-oxo-dGTP diphosphatase
MSGEAAVDPGELAEALTARLSQRDQAAVVPPHGARHPCNDGPVTTAAPLPAPLARYFAGPDGVIQRVRLGAYAWCERDGTVLLTRVSAKGPGGGLWTLPGGGLRFGEDPVAGVTREVREETGYDVALGALVGIRSDVLEPNQTISGHRVQTVGIVYRGTIVSGELLAEFEGSTDAAAWILLDDLEGLPSVDLLAWTRRATDR